MKPNIKCIVCSKLIYRIPSRQNGHNVCSFACRNKYYSGESPVKYKNYRRRMELLLKRKLTKDEIVHHIDGNHSNNELKNLMVTKIHNTIHKKGVLRNSVKVICLNCSAISIINRAGVIRGSGKYCSNKCRFEHWKRMDPYEREKYKAIVTEISENICTTY